MFERLKRLPPVTESTAGPFHLVYRASRGGYRDQRSIAAVKTSLYQELLARHRIIGFDSATVYRFHSGEWNGETWAGVWIRDNAEGTAGANRYLSRSFGESAILLENHFQRDWARVEGDHLLSTVVMPEQPMLEAAVPYRGDHTARRWAHRVLPHLESFARAHDFPVETVLEITDTLYKQVRYLMTRIQC
ncbi:MAG: hypothetical protein EA403_01525 [Spirochaetaceae bacterium]|nr:MAG: hypothetical protein EA403_01525 [Spirochaetaceae bacterium]